MRYNVTDKLPPIFPCDVLNVDGVKIELDIVEFDTESGEVVFQVRDGERYKTALYPPTGTNALPIQIEDCPEIEMNGRKVRVKPGKKFNEKTGNLLIDYDKWEERVVTEKKIFKAPLSIIPYVPANQRPIGV